MFQTSEITAALDEAIAKAQAEIGAAIKDKKNPAFRSDYSSYESVLEACRPALVKHGVSVTQWPVHSTDNRVHLLTRLSLKGEWLQCIFSIPVEKQNAHGFGSAITYLKRFCLSAVLGVPSEFEDDGNLASGVHHAASTPPNTQKTPAPRTSAAPTQSPVATTKTKDVSNHSPAPEGFNPANAGHLKGLIAELTKRNVKGQWQINVIKAMAGKTMADLEGVIKVCNPEAPDEVKE